MVHVGQSVALGVYTPNIGGIGGNGGGGGGGADTFATLNGNILTLADGQTYDLTHVVDTDTDTFATFENGVITTSEGDIINLNDYGDGFATINGTVITFKDGNTFDIASVVDPDTDTFATLSGTTITFPNGDTIDIPANNPNTVSQIGYIGYACSDEVSEVEVTEEVLTFRMPFNMTLTDIISTLNVGQVGGNFITKIYKNGVAITTNIIIEPNTYSTSLLTLTGGAGGSIDSVTVDGLELLSGAVPFNTDLATTTEDLKNNIRDNVTFPNYTAFITEGAITIRAINSGKEPNGREVVFTGTTITATTENFANGLTIETSKLSQVQPTIIDSELNQNDEITMEVIQVGTNFNGAGLKQWLIGQII